MEFSVTTQVPVPVHAPLQPAKTDPWAAAAVSVTVVPVLKFALQPLVQLMPAGLLVTVPLPPPIKATLNWLWVDPPSPLEEEVPPQLVKRKIRPTASEGNKTSLTFFLIEEGGRDSALPRWLMSKGELLLADEL